MASIVHRTPGLMPVESFTTFGINAKPMSTNPIGFFGTGLKIAIAVLVRNNIRVTLFIGQTEYEFYTAKEDFRGKSFDFVRMRKRAGLMKKWSYTKLPFTTELGKKWELWQAYRELHSNTLDEGGTTYKYASSSSPVNGDDNATCFFIEDARYVDVYHDRGRIFLDDALTERHSNEFIQVLDRPSKHIYYRGLRVMDLREEALYTYNVLESLELTEDRTVKYPSILESRIGDFMKQCDDETFLEKAVANPPKQSFEGSLRHHSGYYGVAASSAYLEAAKKSTNVTAKEMWNQAQPTIPTKTILMLHIPKPGLEEHELQMLAELAASAYQGSYIVDEQGTRYKHPKDDVDAYAEAGFYGDPESLDDIPLPF